MDPRESQRESSILVLDVDDRHEFGLGVPTRNVDRLSIANARDPVLVLDGATIERRRLFGE